MSIKFIDNVPSLDVSACIYLKIQNTGLGVGSGINAFVLQAKPTQMQRRSIVLPEIPDHNSSYTKKLTSYVSRNGKLQGQEETLCQYIKWRTWKMAPDIINLEPHTHMCTPLHTPYKTANQLSDPENCVRMDTHTHKIYVLKNIP